MDVLRFTTAQAALLFASGVAVGGYGVGVVWALARWRKSPERGVAVVCAIVGVCLLGFGIAFIVTHNPVAGGG
jgi:uncharacterized membrane protein YczE